MNKKGQQDNTQAIIGLIIFLVVGVPLISGLLISLSNMSCSNEKSQIQSLTNENNLLKNQIDALNQTIQNCTSLIQEQINTCDNKIENATQECQNKINIYADFVITNKFFFVIYNIMIVLLIPLTLNLFKIVIKIGLKEEWEKKIYLYQKIFLMLKIVFWIVLVLAIIGSIILLLISNPVNF